MGLLIFLILMPFTKLIHLRTVSTVNGKICFICMFAQDLAKQETRTQIQYKKIKKNHAKLASFQK